MTRVRGRLHAKAISNVSREEHSFIRGKVPSPSIPSLISLDGLLLAKVYTYFVAKLLQNGAKFLQNVAPGFKNHYVIFQATSQFSFKFCITLQC